MSKSSKDIFKKYAKSNKKDKNMPSLVGVDREMGLYDLTDLFYGFYHYHNHDTVVEYPEVSLDLTTKQPNFILKTMSRFQVFRKVEGVRLGSRPFPGGKGNAAHKPNVSFGYLDQQLKYVALPYKAMLTDSDLVKVRINKRHFLLDTLSKKEKEELEMQARENPIVNSNSAVSDDVSGAYVRIMRKSKKMKEIFNLLPRKIAQEGFAALVHSDSDWAPEIVDALDLVIEPHASHDTSTWSSFFIIKKMTAQQVVKHIREKSPFWNEKALRWALESSNDNRGILDNKHYTGDQTEAAAGENFCVKSFYQEKGSRTQNIAGYYGNMLVVEAYYVNADGKVDKVVFFPSDDFRGIPMSVRNLRKEAAVAGFQDKNHAQFKELEFADVLFHRSDVYESMQDAITIIPFDRSEKTVERQRAYGHELFAPIEMVMRLDSAILNIAILLTIPMYKNPNQGANSNSLEDLELNANGEMQEIGDRTFVPLPFRGDLQSLLGVRSVLLNHIQSKCFLGGLDGQEMTTTGRGANLANLRLIRDGRVHKHTVEDFAQGLQELFSRMFKKILDLKTVKRLLSDDIFLQKNFYDYLIDVQGHSDELFEYEDKDVVPDTGLPYWIEVNAVRNGGSHFGAAEMILYSEIKSMFGDSLNQKSMDALNRMGIRNLLGPDDSFDILGDPKDLLVTEQDQVYRATMENAAIMGSVDQGALNFEQVLTLQGKDDDVAHLREVHNPKANEIIKRLQENEVSPQQMAEFSESQIETRNVLILKLAALANHISLHTQALSRYGARRPEINQLKEETNMILQAAEGLFNSLQINLRVLEQKQTETEAKLKNLSPENEADKLKQQMELERISAMREDSKNKLILANKIADQKQTQHINTQLSKAKDRMVKQAALEREAKLKEVELDLKRSQELNKKSRGEDTPSD